MSSPGKVRSFEDLDVWKVANQLAHEIFSVTHRFPRSYVYDLGNQLRRAALSVPANIAEGSASMHSKELTQSLNVARRSLAETRYLLLFAWEEGLIPASHHEKLADACQSVGRMLTNLVRSIASRRNVKDHA